MMQDVGETSENYLLELVCRASTYGDREAWMVFEQGLQEMVLAWLHAHPGREATWSEQSEQHLVAQAFEQVWQVVRQGQFACKTLSEVLHLLRASLGGAVLEAQRVSSCPKVGGEGMAVARGREGYAHSSEVWDWVQGRLTDERERRLAYLLYHCGLQPIEIVRCCPHEWSDVEEVLRLRHVIFTQLIRES